MIFQKEADNYTLYGALFGAAFPIISSLLKAYLLESDLSFLQSIIFIQINDPLMWIIDSAPIWLGLFARFGGVRQDNMSITAKKLKDSLEKQDTLLKEVESKLHIQEEVNKLQDSIKIEKENLEEINKYSTDEIKVLMDIFKEISHGNLIVKYTPKNSDQSAMISRNFKNLSDAFNNMVKNIKMMIIEVDKSVLSMTSSSQKMSQNSSELKKSSETISKESGNILKNSSKTKQDVGDINYRITEIIKNIEQLIALTNKIDDNMTKEVTKMDSVTGFVDDISDKSKNILTVTKDAVEKAIYTKTTMGKMSDATTEIESSLSKIRRIADQTNLLALNATIEAASAGEAGKGFAVVANAIKELAQRSSEVTYSIANSVKNITTTSTKAIGDVVEISKVITNIDDSANNIKNSIDSLVVETNDIKEFIIIDKHQTEEHLETIKQLKNEVSEVDSRSDSSLKQVETIEKEINHVNSQSSQSYNTAIDVNNSSENILQIANILKTMVGNFKLK